MTTTQRRTPFTDGGAVAAGQFHDEIVGIGQTGRPHDLLTGGFGIGESNVFTHSAAEQQGVLGNNADLTTQGIKLNLADVVAIDQDPALARVVETWQELHQGALATAALAHNADEGSRWDFEIHILENLGLAGMKAEREVFKSHIARQGRQHHF